MRYTGSRVLAKYARLVHLSKIKRDPCQEEWVIKLDEFGEQLLSYQKTLDKQPYGGFFHNPLSFFNRKQEKKIVSGFYLWGGPGRGKTFLMNLFIKSYPELRCKRVHFHDFMRNIHCQLNEKVGISDPLISFSKEISKRYTLICFDEFFVSDIADAMILGKMFEAFLGSGMSVFITSNVEPDFLYDGGLQRSLFLPVIALLKKNCRVVNLDGTIDYRRVLESEQKPSFFLQSSSAKVLVDRVIADLYFSETNFSDDKAIVINDRKIRVKFVSQDIVWFCFESLCGEGRSVADYLQIAKIFKVVVLTEVYSLDLAGDDMTRRFVFLIDALYESNVKFILGSEVEVVDLYKSGRLLIEMSRCISRLIEMQSKNYSKYNYL